MLGTHNYSCRMRKFGPWGTTKGANPSPTEPKVGQSTASGPPPLTFGGEQDQELIAQLVGELEAAWRSLAELRYNLRTIINSRSFETMLDADRAMMRSAAFLRSRSPKLATSGADEPRAPKVSSGLNDGRAG